MPISPTCLVRRLLIVLHCAPTETVTKHAIVVREEITPVAPAAVAMEVDA